MQSHIGMVYVCLSVTCQLHFECCDNTGVERIPKLESAQKIDPGEEIYPAAPAGTLTHYFFITSPAP